MNHIFYHYEASHRRVHSKKVSSAKQAEPNERTERQKHHRELSGMKNASAKFDGTHIRPLGIHNGDQFSSGLKTYPITRMLFAEQK